MGPFPTAAKKYLFSYAYSFSMGEGNICGGRLQEKGLKVGVIVEEREITSGKGV
jgi:hypothetical protein